MTRPLTSLLNQAYRMTAMCLVPEGHPKQLSIAENGQQRK
jgi:hypothetical protein